MGVVELLILAVGLSMDAFAVSVCKGLAMKKAGAKELCIVGCWFGGFQALMPLIGYLLGTAFEQYITSFDHWIAFALLTLIGAICSVKRFRRTRRKAPELRFLSARCLYSHWRRALTRLRSA